MRRVFQIFEGIDEFEYSWSRLQTGHSQLNGRTTTDFILIWSRGSTILFSFFLIYGECGFNGFLVSILVAHLSMF